MLKLTFPLDIHAERDTIGTQFAHLERPTDQNTSWDGARDEVRAHRRIHIAEHGFGVALADMTTYGHYVTRRARPQGGTTTVLRPSLLCVPAYPDPDTDRREHVFEHLLVLGDVGQAIEAGYALNLPSRIRRGERAVAPLLELAGPIRDRKVGIPGQLSEQGAESDALAGPAAGQSPRTRCRA